MEEILKHEYVQVEQDGLGKHVGSIYFPSGLNSLITLGEKLSTTFKMKDILTAEKN